jgi:outer membrane protein assembly factor BamB
VDGASYASPILFEQDGRRMIVSCSLRHAFGVDAATGRLLWTRPLPTSYQVIATTPVRINDAVFVTAPDGQGGTLYRIRTKGAEVEVASVWRAELDTCQGGAAYWNGALYGAMYRRKETWVSLDARNGAVQYRLEGLDKGAVLYADQRLYCLGEDGEIALLKLGAGGFEQMGRFRFVSGRRSDVWAHPVIANGRLYLRYNETLFCYDVKAR